MARFLTTRGTTSEIEKIINDAQKSLVLITPFVKIPASLFQNLISADKRPVQITLIYGKSDLEHGVQEQLSLLKNASIYFLDNLHAKCYFNEQSMVITSLNLYDFSEQNNREMGVLATRQEDEALFKEAVREAQMMIELATPLDLRPTVGTPSSTKTVERVKPVPKGTKEQRGISLLKGFADILLDKVGFGQGYCIGCRTRIEFDEYKPYCPDCYKQWAKNKAKKANYCHECGRTATTSLGKPLCRSCFDKSL
ncbi:phospholipase D family protein [Chloroflexota bacterium]